MEAFTRIDNREIIWNIGIQIPTNINKEIQLLYPNIASNCMHGLACKLCLAKNYKILQTYKTYDIFSQNFCFVAFVQAV